MIVTEAGKVLTFIAITSLCKVLHHIKEFLFAHTLMCIQAYLNAHLIYPSYGDEELLFKKHRGKLLLLITFTTSKSKLNLQKALVSLFDIETATEDDNYSNNMDSGSGCSSSILNEHYNSLFRID